MPKWRNLQISAGNRLKAICKATFSPRVDSLRVTVTIGLPWGFWSYSQAHPPVRSSRADAGPSLAVPNVSIVNAAIELPIANGINTLPTTN